MLTQLEKEELYKSMLTNLSRLSPYIITQFEDPINNSLFQNVIPLLGSHIILEYIANPKKLYQFLYEHKSELIIITEDIFTKRKNYLDIVQGAVCSSPDSMALWTVQYSNEKAFTFKGKMIICTNKTKQEIKADKKLEYFARDCFFI